MLRRDFLDPRRLARTLGQIHGAANDLRQVLEPSSATPAESYTLLRCERRAMAAAFEVLIPFGTPHAQEAAEAALDEIDRLEDQLSVFRDGSEVSQLNRRAPAEEVVVEERLFRLLELAARLWRDTGGAYDVSVGALLKTWGFFRRSAHIPEDTSHLLDAVGMQHVRLDLERLSVRYAVPGLEINLGSIGKGYALDRAAARLRSWGVTSALLHGGRSSILAVGHPPGDPRGWPVAVQHPWDEEKRLAVIYLRDRGMGTSAATFQHLEYNGRKLGHILDPRTGWPAEGTAGATALAPTAVEADALATAFFILGAEGAAAFCAGRADAGALMLPEGGSPVVLGGDDIELTPS
jgi:thiamine biosynthesis lipoprotein